MLYNKLSMLIYDFLQPPGTSIDGDIEFFKPYVLQTDGKILEAGCGNGRMLIPFLRYGIDIEGVDISDDMLDACQRNLDKEKLSCPLIKSDLLTFDKVDYYDLIIAPNGFFNIIEPDKVEIVLNNLIKSLKPGGKIITEFIKPSNFEVGYVLEQKFNLPEGELKIKNTFKDINDVYSYNELVYSMDDILETQEFKVFLLNTELIQNNFNLEKVKENYFIILK